MTITVRYFASLREALGSTEQVDAAGLSLAQLRDRLIASSEAHATVLARGRAVRCALNKQMCDESVVIQDGAEVAFFPPVTGG
ncbi:MoaD/ThiS family protein [Pelomonas sp. V22]|uniref:MoaD/ThiS family protein n=1 Tax=Pelomonas sp. V22 TaxID=2822139 RepID=UPI0024A95B98|nr:MoaD/ThiS family protein [Pelomonas sp. V22]MDI4632130.1 MoaD/ThiS family protein [Pelomonas sp. V22]